MYSLPDQLIRSLRQLEHFDEQAFRAIHESDDQVISVRFNPARIKIDKASWPDAISNPPFHLAGRVPWSNDGYYLTERPSFTLDPLFHAGVYYVQEASGLFLEQAVRQTLDLSQPLKALDLCAAPGGKSTLIQSLISKDSLLVSNEVIKTRVPVLHQNMDKWGRLNGIISNNDPSDFKELEGFFDLMMVDAPCSGSGLFRRDSTAIGEWSDENVKRCSLRQRRILADAWPCLKENGILIYSTCSYSPEENEAILDYLLEQFDCSSIRIPVDPVWHIEETVSAKANGYGYRFYPDKVKGEGFYLTVLRKNGEAGAGPKIQDRPEPANKKEEAALRKFIPGDGLQFVRLQDWIHILPSERLADLMILKNRLYLKKAGVVGGRMADEWVPDHELALSVGLNPEMQGLELTMDEALKYLRRETLSPPTELKGWQPVRFQGQALGWVKILSSRINNYYPKSWRILK